MMNNENKLLLEVFDLRIERRDDGALALSQSRLEDYGNVVISPALLPLLGDIFIREGRAEDE